MPRKLVMAFDYGMRFIGVAVGQPVTKTASAVAVIPAKEGNPEWKQLKSIIKKWRPDTLLVSIPLKMDGTPFSELTDRARQFAKELHKEMSLPVFEVDEKLTTTMAKAEVFAQTGYKGLKQRLDGVAAKIILESWLNQNIS